MAKDIINSAVTAIKEASSAAKLMLKKSIMERSRKQKFQHLGELAYSLYKTNALKSEELKQTVEEIDSINKEIRKAQSHISKTSNKEEKKNVKTKKTTRKKKS